MEQKRIPAALRLAGLILALCLLLPGLAQAEAGRPLYAAQGENGLWGYIDSQGNWAIEPQFDAAVDFYGDYACVSVYREETEEEADMPQDEEPAAVEEEAEEGGGRKYFDDEDWYGEDWEDENSNLKEGIIDVTGAWVLEPDYDITALTDSGEWSGDCYRVSQWQDSAKINGWFNLSNGYFSGLLYERVYASQSGAEDSGALLVTRQEDGAWAYVDRLTGVELIPFQEEWEKAGDYAEGCVLVKKGRETALLDGSGNVIRPVAGLSIPAYSQVSQGLIQVEDAEGLMGFMNTAGETVIAPAFAWADDFHEGAACVQFPEGDYGHVDLSGEVLYRGASQRYSFSGGLAALLDDDEADTMVFIRMNGEEVFRVTAEGLYSVGEFDENGVAVYHAMKIVSHYNAEWDYEYNTYRAQGLLSADGSMLTEPVLYLIDATQGTLPYSQGLAAVCDVETLLAGYVDAQGQWVIPPQYDSAGAFRDGLARVSLGNTECYIDQEGNVLFSYEKQ